MKKIRSLDLLWDILLGIKIQFNLNPSVLKLTSVEFTPHGFHILLNQKPAMGADQPALVVCFKKIGRFRRNTTYVLIDEDLLVQVLFNDIMSNNEIEFLRCFLPFCVLPHQAYKLKRAVSVLHLAQSLDGRIATLSGASRWISNNENLLYVHRLRALCDSILIGANTLHKDNPALTVRHVSGPNPIKIVVGNSASDFSSLMASQDKIIHFTSQPGIRHNGTETICLPGTSGFIPPVTLLEALYKQGINSVYIEGGAFTSSSFIANKAADIINLFISPKILGSGLSINFPGISKIEECICLQGCRFIPMGDGMLVTGIFKF